ANEWGVAERLDPGDALAGELGRAGQVEGIVRALRARGGAVEPDGDIGEDGALAAERPEAGDAVRDFLPATAGARSAPAIELARGARVPARAPPGADEDRRPADGRGPRAELRLAHALPRPQLLHRRQV